MGNQIHWFPGHMNKALKEIESKVKLVDLVIELLDLRIPLSSYNEEFDKYIGNKKRLFVFTKQDLADPVQTKKWADKFNAEGKDFLFLDVIHGDVNNVLNKKIKALAEEKHNKDISKGMKPQPIRAMILGIPNVGKSSLINKIAKRKAAGVENRPGFTKGEQMIKVNNDFLLLDTPGVLPMNYENKQKAVNLALVGSIKEDILPLDDLANFLISFLREYYPYSLKERFDINEILDTQEILEKICKKRGLLTNCGVFDTDKALNVLLREFKDGKLGRFTLEWIK